MTSEERTRTHDPTTNSQWTRFRNRHLATHRASTVFSSHDPQDLERRLAQSDCFCRDTAVGKLYHRRQISYREISANDSLHVTIGTDGQVSSHVDRHSPLARRQPGGDCRYSPLRVAAHNMSGMAGDLVRLVLGRRAVDPEHDASPALTDHESVVHTVATREKVAADGAVSPVDDGDERPTTGWPSDGVEAAS